MYLLIVTNELYTTGAGNVSSHYLPHFTCGSEGPILGQLIPTLILTDDHLQFHSQTLSVIFPYCVSFIPILILVLVCVA